MLRPKTFDFLVKGTIVELNPDFMQLDEIAKKMNREKSDFKTTYSPEDWAERFEGSDWTHLDEKRLTNLFHHSDESIEEISKILGRSVKSVEEKLVEKYGPDVLKNS